MAKVTVTKRKPTHLQIANRAFEIYLSRGRDMVTMSVTGLKLNGSSIPNFSRRSGRSSKPRRKGSRCLSAAALVSHPG